jgi:hypothetical protein
MIMLVTQELAQGPCPACGQPIVMQYAVDVDQVNAIPNGELADVTLNGTVAGVHISHDCIPPTKREPVDERPHSRACGMHAHPHGDQCHSNCPTCHGEKARALLAELRAEVAEARRKVLQDLDGNDIVSTEPPGPGKLSEAELRAMAADQGFTIRGA